MNAPRHTAQRMRSRDTMRTCDTIQSPKRKRGVSTPAVPDSGRRNRERGTGNGEQSGGEIHHSPFRIHHSAFSLAESLVSMLLIAGVLVAALNTVGASTAGQCRTADRAVGHLLAQDLMAEILRQSYEEPVDTPTFGIEAGESPVSRLLYDDVDDYHGWQASPPRVKENTTIPEHTNWRRSVTIEHVNKNNLNVTVGGDPGIKRITVTVEHNDIGVASLVAIRTQPLPLPNPAPTILFVATNSGAPTGQETLRITLFESWGYQVALIDASALQSEFDDAVMNADVAYISEEIDPAMVGTKLREASIGVANEEMELTDEFGFGEFVDSGIRDLVQVTNNTHYITSPFSIGPLTLFSSSQPAVWRVSVGTSDALTLAETSAMGGVYKPSLAVLELGDVLCDGGTAAARRVELPWGDDAFDFSALNADGQTIMKRAIEWAASLEAPGP